MTHFHMNKDIHNDMNRVMHIHKDFMKTIDWVQGITGH